MSEWQAWHLVKHCADHAKIKIIAEQCGWFKPYEHPTAIEVRAHAENLKTCAFDIILTMTKKVNGHSVRVCFNEAYSKGFFGGWNRETYGSAVWSSYFDKYGYILSHIRSPYAEVTIYL